MGLKSDNPCGRLGRLMICNPDNVIYLTRLLVPDWLGSVKLCLPKVLNHGRSLVTPWCWRELSPCPQHSSRRQNGTFLLALYAPFNLSDNASLPQHSSIRGRRTLLTRFEVGVGFVVVHIGGITTLNNRWAHGGPAGGLQAILRGNAIYRRMIERPKPGITNL